MLQPLDITQDSQEAVKAAIAHRQAHNHHAIAYATLDGYTWVTEQDYWQDPSINPLQCYYWTREGSAWEPDLEGAMAYIAELKRRAHA